MKWRTPIQAGYSGPAVAKGHVFLLDHTRPLGPGFLNECCASKERTGTIVWTRTWLQTTGAWTIRTDLVQHLLLMAIESMFWERKVRFRCLRTKDGTEIWSSDFVRDFGAAVPGWGTSSAPLVVGSKLIAVTGGKCSAKVVAFDKYSGKEIWRALSSDDSEPGILSRC